jgi:hypothetical protein
MTRRLPSAPPQLPGLDYVRPLGSGGFADVFLYQQDMPRRAVAVKVLPAGERDPDLLRMFNAEADVWRICRRIRRSSRSIRRESPPTDARTS